VRVSQQYGRIPLCPLPSGLAGSNGLLRGVQQVPAAGSDSTAAAEEIVPNEPETERLRFVASWGWSTATLPARVGAQVQNLPRQSPRAGNTGIDTNAVSLKQDM